MKSANGLPAIGMNCFPEDVISSSPWETNRYRVAISLEHAMSSNFMSILVVSEFSRALHQDFPLADIVRRTDYSLMLHPLHKRGGAVVADLQSPLDIGGRGFLVPKNERNRLIVKIAGA